MLGLFIKKANWIGTLSGALLSIVVLALVKYATPINFYIYPLIAIPVCVIGGYVTSLLFPVGQKDIDGLVYSKDKTLAHIRTIRRNKLPRHFGYIWFKTK